MDTTRSTDTGVIYTFAPDDQRARVEVPADQAGKAATYRAAQIQRTADGVLWIALVQQTRAGRDYASGRGMWISEDSGRFPQYAEIVAYAQEVTAPPLAHVWTQQGAASWVVVDGRGMLLLKVTSPAAGLFAAFVPGRRGRYSVTGPNLTSLVAAQQHAEQLLAQLTDRP